MGKSKDLATGASYQDQNESDARYVNTVGDTVTGALYLNTTLGSRQLDITGVEADIWLNSTGPNKTWRILGSTGSNTHKLRFYDHSNAAERMAIDASGRVTMPYQPSFEAYRTLGNLGQGNVVVFNNTRHNTGNHYNTSNGTFTAPVAGWYVFTAQGFTNIGVACTIDMQVNNVNRMRMEADTNNSYRSLTGSSTFYLNINDTVRLYITAGTAHYNTTGLYSNFTGGLIG